MVHIDKLKEIALPRDERAHKKFLERYDSRHMTLKLKSGCICDSMTVNGVEEVDMDDSRRLEVLDAIRQFMDEKIDESNGRLPDELNNRLGFTLSEFNEEEDLVITKDDTKNMVSKPHLLNYILQDIIPYYGDMKSLGRCDCCGDSIYEWTLRI